MHASSPGSAYVQQYMNLGLLMETIFCFVFFQSLSFTLKSRNLQFITGNNYCRCFVCFMVLIVRLQSDPQSEWFHYDHSKKKKKVRLIWPSKHEPRLAWPQYITRPGNGIWEKIKLILKGPIGIEHGSFWGSVALLCLRVWVRLQAANTSYWSDRKHLTTPGL